ncbi:HK97-gp10 family putative phage morphogenesis protein [Paenibacillus apiarius]|uniref:HK97 gp10 family phage protein n=1 Tax=Paenibacillus apiarius TaxID=46240 RepID=A0ABT4DQT0_9BACL|nr:HK97-gp10 family putative phage morphogenesis protein [Paenibacillus apiarius]MCY9513313.1 HK97 gp10 family phage protein [Paenibacillus apiarius]MCY9519715.1 HK97 gp10 family phage protein [Paenibacillus apiarius]MCY9553229.1 HK97 gp10 family phage protein [Paenibacillus apiarius]MCY9557079.1 HK97 gp10 family phage protein [Paenibacillus apiarius]MCY9682180.1 HK97 gp10 family phage protein [Paenibacillus apiarius]
MTIKNLDRLLQKLDSLGGNSQKALKTGIHQATKLVQGDAKMLAPVRPGGGRLRDSIQGEVEEREGKVVGKVSTNVEYAAYVEFGTGQRGEASPSPPKSSEDLSYRQDWAGMPAQPFLFPALKQNEETIRKMITSNVRKEIRKLGGS